jgi:hypothetical protein
MKIIFNVYNPWSDTWAILWNKSKLLGKNKAVEFNGYRTNHIVNVDFQFNPVGDHAGASIMLGLFGYDVELHFYDTRHWNYLTNTWESHE